MLKFSRQTDIINPDKLDMPIVVVGAGAVGSWATLALAKMGCSDITVIDHDTVEEANVGSQLYGLKDIGEKKVYALQKIVEENMGTRIKVFSSKAEAVLGEVDKVILILALDSIKARQQCIIANQGKPPVFIIDIRMKNELISAYLAFDQDSTENFKLSFDPTIKVDKGKCSEKAVSYNTFICGGLVANLVKKIANKENLPFGLVVDLKTLSIN